MANFSDELDEQLLGLTAEILKKNPDIYTFWNIRRDILGLLTTVNIFGLFIILSVLETRRRDRRGAQGAFEGHVRQRIGINA